MYKLLITLVCIWTIGLGESCRSYHTYKVVLNINKSVSDTLIPPKGCHNVEIVANGKLTCQTVLIVNMEQFEAENTFSPLFKLKIDGNYTNHVLHMGDWYDNKMILEIENSKCLNGELGLKVTFFD
jgi:hypothetical protein